MIKFCMMVINMMMLLTCYVDCTTAEEPQFFPEEIRVTMHADIDAFLRHLPTNQGQREYIEYLLQRPDYSDILVFVPSSFSIENVQQAAQLSAPFTMIQTLDMLASNLDLKESFGSWYFSQLYTNLREHPEVYMRPFVRFVQQSDGDYAEWFADPLTVMIETYPEIFAQELLESNTWQKVCGILQTGDEQKISESLTILLRIVDASENPAIQQLLNCVANKSIQE